MSNKLVVKQIYGLTANSRNSLAFASDHSLVYNSGAYVVVMNTESKEQGFINVFGSHVQNNKSLGCTAITTSMPKKFIAVAERGEANGLVVFYDSHSLRKKKVLNFPELGSKEYKCVAFSDDGRQCLTQGAGPDWNLVLWAVEKHVKVVASVKISLSDDNPVNQVSFCPWDATLAVVIGKGFVRMFRIVDGVLKSTPLPVRRDNANFISHIWLPDDVLLLGTEGGEILLVENNEYRGVIYPSQSVPGMGSSASVTSGAGGPGSVSSGVGGAGPGSGSAVVELTPVHCFCQTPRGFVAGTYSAMLHSSLPSFSCFVSVFLSFLSIYCYLSAFSDTAWHESNHLSLNQSTQLA
jgi:cilia- and flagella-associated protein 57